MKQYWPQHKVFFVGTIALFPERLKGQTITELFYKPFFPRDEVGFIEIMLTEHQKDGYIEYEKDSENAYKITEVHAQKATDDLIEYLNKWQHDKLLSLPADKPPDAVYQQTLLLDAITRAYSNHQNEPRVTQKDVYGDLSDKSYKPPFWELVLACQLLQKNIKIKYMDYDRRIDGLYDDDAQPVVDFQIVSKKYEQAIIKALPPAQLTNTPTNTDMPIRLTIRSYDPDSGVLFLNGQEIQIILQKGRRGKAIGETTQGSAMRKLFKDVNTLNNGVPLRTITSVSPTKFDAEKRKLAINHLAEINRKIKEATGIPKLIIHDQVKYYVAKSYLS